jgi:3-oxoacyl-[acyl-carrier protein] reductase
MPVGQYELNSMASPSVLVFGGSGVIGAGIVRAFVARGWSVVASGRTAHGPSADIESASPDQGVRFVVFDPFVEQPNYAGLAVGAPYSAVVWAQGANANDSIYDVDVDQHVAMLLANCVFITKTLNSLLTKSLVVPRAAKFCVVSSIWQNIARQNKYSYTVSKAAIKGLVQAASIDLARDGHVINAVLPGVVDTPMTRANLSEEQINTVAAATPFNRLVGLDDVCAGVYWFCSPENKSATGQFMAVDLGFSHVRML